MREYTPPPAEDGDDPWGFVTAKNPRRIDPSADSLLGKAVPDAAGEPEPVATPTSRVDSPAEESAIQALRRRARPLSWAVAAAFLFGFITEVYAAAAFAGFSHGGDSPSEPTTPTSGGRRRPRG